jgi:hypothetical protein
MIRLRHVLGLLALVLVLPVASASASATQETTYQDNRLLLDAPAQLTHTLATLRLLGVSRLRISVLWYRLAPASESRSKPKGFHASDPSAYAAASWAPYDTIAVTAARFGIGVNFDLMGGAPLWATRRTGSANLAHLWYPSASEFGAFASAVGKRYSGHYKPPGFATALPRVKYWSIWNEPNVGGSSLAPQTVHKVEVAPSIYRALTDAAYGALKSTGHGGDTILVGELASTGHADPGSSLGMQPLRFLRALFCVDSRYKQLRGSAASVRGCPKTAAASRGFRKAHPALFNETGWSHHPYHLVTAPDVKSPKVDADWVTLADLPKLETALDRLQKLYGSRRKLPVYLTEYGFDTNPPQTFNAVDPATQAAYINQAEYIAWHDGRVQTMSQYLLQDEALAPGAEFSAFTSGLIFADGTLKPSFDAYRLPLWLPSATASRGQSVTVWGCIKPVRFSIPEAGPQNAEIQFQPGSSGPFMTIQPLTITRANSCYFTRKVAFPESGSVRLAYTYPANDPVAPGVTITSRAVPVTLH